MKRLHINLTVADLDQSIRFYSTLFETEPTLTKHDYAKWMLDDPRVNFAISTHGPRKGIDHLGIQAENSAELDEIFGRLKKADAPTIEQGETVCCYAESEKTWVFDPDGVAWETFLTLGESTVYGEGRDRESESGGACCDRPTLDMADQLATQKTPEQGACCDRPSVELATTSPGSKTCCG